MTTDIVMVAVEYINVKKIVVIWQDLRVTNPTMLLRLSAGVSGVM